MSDYKVLNNYLLFKQQNLDSSGVNSRGADIQENRPVEHKLITEVHPFYTEDENTWKRIALLLEGVKKSNITHLYSPDKIVRSREATLLIFPYIKGKTLEQVMDDAQKRDVPVNFDLAFSIVMAIADQLDVGSTIVISGKKSFHGFLTPDNIIVDYDGNISLKNYGIAPFLEENDKVFREMEMKYGAWMAPEFMRREKVNASSDIYHMGYIIYRMLTGQYFSHSTGEDFDSMFSNLSFSHFMPTTNKDFITHLINFFKKTLNPDPMKRFSSIREFKDYIANFFEIEELSSVTFNLSYFMNSLYARDMEEEEREMSRELEYEIPVAAPEESTDSSREPGDSEIVEQILSGLDDSRGSRSKLMIPLIAVVLIAVGVVGYILVTQSSKAKIEAAKVQASVEQRMAELQKSMDKEYQEKLQAIEQKIANTEAEQKAKDEEIRRIKEQRDSEIRTRQEKIRKEQEAVDLKKKQEEEAKLLEENKQKQEAQAKIDQAAEEKRKQEEAKLQLEASIEGKVKKGEAIEMQYVTQPPKKTGGDDPYRSRELRKLFRGKKVTVTSRILIDEFGRVSRVRFSGNVEPGAKMELSQILATWTYAPAKWNDKAVKVWLEVPLTFNYAE